jgi:lysozyme
MANEFSALDVSQYQGNIDWTDLAAQVAAGTLGGVMVRATYGLDGVDPDFASNWRGAAQAGVPAGPYHYADPAQPADAQASHFWTTVEAAGGWPHRYLRPALDLEQLGGLADAALQSWATAWLTAVEQAGGVMPMLYGAQDFLEAHVDAILGHWPLWVADWGGTVDLPHVGHQFTDAGHIAGIGGVVDEDRFAASVLLTTPVVAPTVDWAGSTGKALRWHFTPPTTPDYRGWAQHPDTPAADPVFRSDGGYWDVSWVPTAQRLVLTWWFGTESVSVDHPLLDVWAEAEAAVQAVVSDAQDALAAIQAARAATSGAAS